MHKIQIVPQDNRALVHPPYRPWRDKYILSIIVQPNCATGTRAHVFGQSVLMPNKCGLEKRHLEFSLSNYAVRNLERYTSDQKP